MDQKSCDVRTTETATNKATQAESQHFSRSTFPWGHSNSSHVHSPSGSMFVKLDMAPTEAYTAFITTIHLELDASAHTICPR